jgi:hypothetical protein
MTQPEFHVHIHNESCCGDQDLAARVSALEAQVMALTDTLTAINTSLTELQEDVTALQAAVADGTPEVQALVSEIAGKLAGVVDTVGDADADGNPAVTPPPPPAP